MNSAEPPVLQLLTLVTLILTGGKEFGSEYNGHVLRVKGVGIGAEECHYAIRVENDTYRLFDEDKGEYR